MYSRILSLSKNNQQNQTGKSGFVTVSSGGNRVRAYLEARGGWGASITQLQPHVMFRKVPHWPGTALLIKVIFPPQEAINTALHESLSLPCWTVDWLHLMEPCIDTHIFSEFRSTSALSCLGDCFISILPDSCSHNLSSSFSVMVLSLVGCVVRMFHLWLSTPYSYSLCLRSLTFLH